MTILVTGVNGMIGSRLAKGLLDAGYDVIGVDRTGEDASCGNCRYCKADLADKGKLAEIAGSNQVDRIIHLAALAHTEGESNLTWERYKQINVDCARNVFEVAGDRPVLFISTVDVFGFYNAKEPVSGETEIRPVSDYGKSKALAEEECRKLSHYTIFRFSPVYTENNKRDIQKRYYLKYPNIAYQVGKGSGFEVLSIENAVSAMVGWCNEEPKNNVRIVKDPVLMWTPDYIRAEKAAGRAKTVLHFPQWTVKAGYGILKAILGENEKTYLLNKAVYPLRSK